MQRHKIFISFYHQEAQKYKNYISECLCANLIDKSVESGEYDSDLCTEYIKRLIREDKITDSSVIVVLISPNAYKRKHVDWEIYAGLRKSINGRAGLLGILLPEYQMSPGNKYRYDDIPARLADNVKTGFAAVYTWDYAVKNFYSIVDDAFDRRISMGDKADNTRIQMERNKS